MPTFPTALNFRALKHNALNFYALHFYTLKRSALKFYALIR